MPCLFDDMRKNYNLCESYSVIVTSESGDKLTNKNNTKFFDGEAIGDVIHVNPEIIKQTIDGIGTSFTESSAYVLAHLEPKDRIKVMQNIFSEKGANFSLARTHIGACDFCVEGKYSYAEVKDDKDLKHFSVAVDEDGFDVKKYPSIKDENYDLLPMLQEAQAIKNAQDDRALKIVASPWTAPAWMKTNQDWYTSGSAENNYQGTGGELKHEYQEAFANYFIRYLKAYKSRGVSIWGVTPVNEPYGNNGQWESMNFTAQTQKNFITKYLGPKLLVNYPDVKLLMFDHNRDGLEEWADEMYADPESAQYIDGAAVHWYESTFKVYEDVFEKVHAKYPNHSIIHTEGCIDDLGKDAPDGVLDPKGYKGIDWNIVLDKNGGPNHVGNFCGAPIMVDTETQYVYYTPIFYILAQFSKYIRPGDKVVKVDLQLSEDLIDTIYSTATLNNKNILTIHTLNTSKSEHEYSLKIGSQIAKVKIAANCLQSIRVQL